MLGVCVQLVADGANDPTMADHQYFATRVLGSDVAERGAEALRGCVVRLEAVGSASFREVAGPTGFDLVTREALPRTDVDLA